MASKHMAEACYTSPAECGQLPSPQTTAKASSTITPSPTEYRQLQSPQTMADPSSTVPTECAQQQLSQTIVDATPTECRELQPERLMINGLINGLTLQVVNTHKIFRFPPVLQKIGRDKDWIEPEVVAIGPYYHGHDKLKPMEVVKSVAVNIFFMSSSRSLEDTYEGIKAIARDVRCCYADADAFQGTTDDSFAEMMLVDGCFLVLFFGDCSILRRMTRPHWISILNDIMLLENQIPWAVMDFLMQIIGLSWTTIINLLSMYLFGEIIPTEALFDDQFEVGYKPSHILCLFRSFIAGKNRRPRRHSSSEELPMSTSAAELTEIAINLRARKNTRLADINITEGWFLATLTLPPLYLDKTTACWIVNIGALETWTDTSLYYSFNSYLSFLALLMNQESDVRQLRKKGIVHGYLGDQQTLEFLKSITQDLVSGEAHCEIIGGIQAYRKKRCWWIPIYRFVYNNVKTISMVASAIGVLVGIFKAILSLKPSH